jgi:cold shock CspA family protein
MFQQMLKTYQFKDVVVHKRAAALNAMEYCSLYPNQGVGFKIRRKTWPKG